MFWTLNFAVDKNGGPFCKLLPGNTALYTLIRFDMILSGADLFCRLLKNLLTAHSLLEIQVCFLSLKSKSLSKLTLKRFEILLPPVILPET